MSKIPCNPDHNGECLVCDCWLSECALMRLRTGNFNYESFEELLGIFKKFLTEEEIRDLQKRYGS